MMNNFGLCVSKPAMTTRLITKTLVYQEAIIFVRAILTRARVFGSDQSELRSQLRRAVTKIPLNIAEGWGRHGARDKRRFYRYALGSVTECVGIIETAEADQLISSGEKKQFVRSLGRIAKLLGGLIRVMDSRL